MFKEGDHVYIKEKPKGYSARVFSRTIGNRGPFLVAKMEEPLRNRALLYGGPSYSGHDGGDFVNMPTRNYYYVETEDLVPAAPVYKGRVHRPKNESKVLRFLDYINEFKGSSEHAGTFERLIEFLRMRKEKDGDVVSATYDELEAAGIPVEDLRRMDAADTNFYSFEIDFGPDRVEFRGVGKEGRRNRPFESVTESAGGPKFKIGDRVRTIGDVLYNGRIRVPRGSVGTVVNVWDHRGKVVTAVEFDHMINGHCCSGHAKNGHGWDFFQVSENDTWEINNLTLEAPTYRTRHKRTK